MQEHMKLTEDQVRMIQIDDPKRRVYIKLVSADKIHALLRDLGGQKEYIHANGEISIVTIEQGGMGERKVRIAYLPLEATDRRGLETLEAFKKKIWHDATNTLCPMAFDW
jgi:hypothetical protein